MINRRPLVSGFGSVFFAGLMVIVISACEGQREFVVVDQREVLGSVETETTDYFDNTSGSEDLIQDVSVTKQFRYTPEIELEEGSGLDRKTVEDRVYETYDLEVTTGRAGGAKTCLISIVVPPGEAHAFNLEWRQVKREGIIRSGTDANSGDILGQYNLTVDMQCQTTGVEVR